MSEESVKEKEIRINISNDYVGMTMPILVKTWLDANRKIEDLAKAYDLPFVDAYNFIPHELLYLEDHVHLTDEGNELLGRYFAEVLAKNKKILQLKEDLAHIRFASLATDGVVQANQFASVISSEKLRSFNELKFPQIENI